MCEMTTNIHANYSTVGAADAHARGFKYERQIQIVSLQLRISIELLKVGKTTVVCTRYYIHMNCGIVKLYVTVHI